MTQPFGLCNPGCRCWFNAAFQAWCSAGRSLRKEGIDPPLAPTPYCKTLSDATYGVSQDRADAFFAEFSRWFFAANPQEAASQHDPVAAFCAIPAHTEENNLRVQFLGLTTRGVTCSRCHSHVVTHFPEPVYSCSDTDVLGTAEGLSSHVQGIPAATQTVTGVEIPRCNCPRSTTQILKETRRLPRILVLAINSWEPSPAKAALPRVFSTPTHTHTLIAAICKSGPPSGGHCWAYVAAPNGWWRCNDTSVSAASNLDNYVIAGIYARTSKIQK